MSRAEACAAAHADNAGFTSFFILGAWFLSALSGCPSLPVPNLSPQPDARDTHLIRLVHITDPQVIDEESPARSVRTESLIAPSWRPHEALAIHTLDATLQRINTLHNAGRANGRPVDFVVMTGDLCDLAQENELQWFMDTMDGQEVTADSGALDGTEREAPESLNPKLPYHAAGLNREIPWYTCYGNHDGLATGTFPIDRSTALPELWSAPLLPIVADAIGFHEIDPAWNFMLPAADFSPAIITGAAGAPLRDNGTVLDLDALESGPIEPDPARRFLSRRTFIEAHLESTTLPRGHGFTERSLAREEVWYSVRPLPEVPVRLIVFNSVATGPHYGLPLYYGVLTRRHFEDFLVPALEAAEAAGEWVILASHHPSVDFDLPYFQDRVSTGEFRETLSRYPGVVVHLAGHTHRNNASIIPGEHPYIEIETGAIIDYPQEGRMLDLFVAEDGASIRIESRMFSHADAPTTFSAESYRLAEIDFGVRDAKARAKSNGASGLGDPRGAALDRDFDLRLAR
jgi:3',5'-cyclic AMP phosphodiesterase CpdA